MPFWFSILNRVDIAVDIYRSNPNFCFYTPKKSDTMFNNISQLKYLKNELIFNPRIRSRGASSMTVGEAQNKR